jgi:iron complex outermembrane receptor protein
MGWRSAFGVRGVQILLDGIPLTMPDGQAFADIVTPSLIHRAELIRGPASLYWGNGSGGVLYLTSMQPGAEPGVRVRAMGGTHGLRQLTAEGHARIGANRFQVFVNDDRRDGYREYSTSRFTRASIHGVLPAGEKTVIRLMSAFADQDAKNPGSLTAAQVEENPRLANTTNVNTLAAKRSQQFQLGGSVLHQSAIGELSATAYGIFRDLDNPLSFAYIDLTRSAGGLRLALEDSYERISWGIGADAGFQDDDRLNFDNEAGRPGSERTLAQRETVQTLSACCFFIKIV